MYTCTYLSFICEIWRNAPVCALFPAPFLWWRVASCPFICVTWPIHICVTHLYSVTWLIPSMSSPRSICRMAARDIALSHMVPWLILKSNVTHSYLWHYSLYQFVFYSLHLSNDGTWHCAPKLVRDQRQLLCYVCVCVCVCVCARVRMCVCACVC